MLALAFGVIVVRRRTVAIGLLATQALALAGFLAVDLAENARSGYVVAAVLLGKAVVLPTLLYVVIRRTPEAGPVAAPAGPMVRLAAAGTVALCAVLLTPSLGLGAPRTEHIAVALVLVGIAIVIARRPILFGCSAWLWPRTVCRCSRSLCPEGSRT